jgi:hypothetical protein
MQASLELQRAVAVALQEDEAVQRHGLAVFDGPPADARAPYVSIGVDVVVPRGWAGGGGEAHRFRVSLWDRREGLAPAKAMLADLQRAVLAMPGRAGMFRLVGLRLVRASVRRTRGGWTLGELEFGTLSVRED